jgi:hypothetical protein
MLKKFMIGTALSALALSTAVAQSSPPASGESSSPPAMSSSPSTGGQASSGQKFVSSQTPDQFLATKFTGTDVVGADDKKIGDVNDVLFDKQGKIMAYVVGVGGFLGIGSKNVALNPSSFEVMKGDGTNADKLKLSMSKEDLQNAPAFEPYKEPSRTATTGAGGGAGGAGSRPGGSPAR